MIGGIFYFAAKLPVQLSMESQYMKNLLQVEAYFDPETRVIAENYDGLLRLERACKRAIAQNVGGVVASSNFYVETAHVNYLEYVDSEPKVNVLIMEVVVDDANWELFQKDYAEFVEKMCGKTNFGKYGIQNFTACDRATLLRLRDQWLIDNSWD